MGGGGNGLSAERVFLNMKLSEIEGQIVAVTNLKQYLYIFTTTATYRVRWRRRWRDKERNRLLLKRLGVGKPL